MKSQPLVSRLDDIEWVKERVRRSRGKELPGTCNPRIIGDLFREQCKNWQGLALNYLVKILNDTNELIAAILDEVAAPETRHAIAARVHLGMDAIRAT